MIDPLLSKIPPHDLEMEESVLSSILISNKGFDDIEDLLPGDFYKPAHKKIFQTMLELKSKKEPVDLLTIKTALEKNKGLKAIGGIAYVVKISETAPLPTNIKAYANRVSELARAREMIFIATQIAAAGFNTPNIEKYISDSQSAILDIQTTMSKDKFTTMSDMMMEALDRIKSAQKSEFKLGLSFGMPKLDNYMQVWGSKLILLAGRPGMGKSSLAFSIAVRLGFNREPCGILSIEMDKEQFADKTLSAEADINSMIFYARNSINKAGYNKLSDAASALADLPIYVDDSECNIEDVERKCRKLKKLGCKIIMIDQLNQIRFDKGLAPYIGISKNCAALKRLTKELRIPIVLLCQLNRNLEGRGDKRPTKADLAETGRLEQDADMILFLYREGYYNKNLDEGTTEINLAKNRQGETGTEFQVLFNKKRGMFQMGA